MKSAYRRILAHSRRFKATNPHFTDFDDLGQPVFAGWIFNGFDTARKRRVMAVGAPTGEKEMIQADRTMHDRVAAAVRDDLVGSLNAHVRGFQPIANRLPLNYRIGDIEDANVLIQNSLWLSVPLGELDHYDQVVSLQDRRRWAGNQIEQIQLIKSKFWEAALNVEVICV